MRALPPNPNLEQLKNQAKALLKAYRSADSKAAFRLRQSLPEMAELSDEEILEAKVALKDTQRAVALEHGFDSWRALSSHVRSLQGSAPAADDVAPRTRRIEELARAGRLSPREAEYLQEGGTGWLVDQMREGGEYRDRELEFIGAALIRGHLHTCDVERMQAMLAETPELIETAGPAALATAVQAKECLPAVEVLLRHGVSRLTLNPLEHNELSQAVYGDNYNGVRAVFEAGLADASDIQQRSAHSGWPAHVGLLFWGRRQARMTELLLDYGAEQTLEVPDRGGRTPLQHIVWEWDAISGRWEGNFPAGRLYLERGAYYDLFSACGFGDVERVRELIADDPACVNARHASGSAPLHWAARQNSVACAKLLVQHGAEVDPVYPSLGLTPFLYASQELSRFFLEHGADINARDKKGRTKLHYATSGGDGEFAEELMARGADMTLRNNSGKTPLEVARRGAVYLQPTKSGERRWPGPGVPETVFDVAKLPGIGMKTVRLLYEQHGVGSLGGVRRMVEEGSLARVKGISAKTADAVSAVLDLDATIPEWPGPGGWPERLKTMVNLHRSFGVRSVDDILRIIEDGTFAPFREEWIGGGTYHAILTVLGVDE